MIKYFFTRQFLRFISVGGLAAFLNWLARVVLSSWLSFPWAVAIAYVVGMTVAFILNSVFVFPESEKSKRAQARGFIFINISFFPVVWIASIEIDNFLQTLGMKNHSEAVAHALAISLPMLVTFLLYKFFAFKEKNYG